MAICKDLTIAERDYRKHLSNLPHLGVPVSVVSVASSVLEELVPSSNRLYFIFGGIASEIGMPPFEFYNASRILTENKIFLRDFTQSWYQNGLPGYGRDVFDIAEYLAAKSGR